MDFRRLKAAGNPSRNLIFYSLLLFYRSCIPNYTVQ